MTGPKWWLTVLNVAAVVGGGIATGATGALGLWWWCAGIGAWTLLMCIATVLIEVET